MSGLGTIRPRFAPYCWTAGVLGVIWILLIVAMATTKDPDALLNDMEMGYMRSTIIFGIAGIASTVLGGMADKYGIEAVYNVCAFMPLLGLVACFLPNLKKR